MNREDRLELLSEMVSWRRYECQGLTDTQQMIIVGNVLDGKPQDKWLEGVFDRDLEQAAFRNLLREDAPLTEQAHTQERGGREM